jgi:murein L,D-transpeptidase YcbB/YkuD
MTTSFGITGGSSWVLILLGSDFLIGGIRTTTTTATMDLRTTRADDSQAYDYRYWYGVSTRVQTELSRLGYYHGPIDGVISLRSQEAIKAFQQAEGQPATGLINPALLKALRLPAVPRMA